MSRNSISTKEKNIRVTFTGGDVHACGMAKISPVDSKESDENNPQVIYQWITSPIGNIPAPNLLTWFINKLNATARKLNDLVQMHLETLHEKFGKKSFFGLLNRRNFLVMQLDTETQVLKGELLV